MNQIFYLKLTNRCNLRCMHCYNRYCTAGVDMPLTVIDKALEYIIQQSQCNKQIVVILHGGEPMLVKTEILDYIISKLKLCQNIVITMTTNLAYQITDDIQKFFINNHNVLTTISTSWDYKIRFAENQEDLWKRNLMWLKDIGINVIPIITLTNDLIHDIIPQDLFQFLKNIGVYQINFERLTITGEAKNNLHLKPLNHDVRIWCLNTYKCSKKENIEVNLFRAIEESIYNNQLIGCRQRQCQRCVITINPDGTLAGCPNTADTLTYGNLDSIDTNKKEKYCRLEHMFNTECLICPYFKFCNGDCFQLTYDETGCPGLIELIKYILNNKQHEISN